MQRTLDMIMGNEELKKRLMNAKTFEEVYDLFRELKPDLTEEEFEDFFVDFFKEIGSYDEEEVKKILEADSLSEEDLSNISGGKMSQRVVSAAIASLVALPSVGVRAVKNPVDVAPSAVNSQSSKKKMSTNKKIAIAVPAVAAALAGAGFWYSRAERSADIQKDKYSELSFNKNIKWKPAWPYRGDDGRYQALTNNGHMTTASGEKMSKGRDDDRWCIAHVKAHMADIANDKLVQKITEFPTKVYTQAIDDNAEHPTSEEPQFDKDTWETEIAERILAGHPDWKGKIMLVDSANNNYRGGTPAGANTQEESQFTKSLCNYWAVTSGAKRYYQLGRELHFQPWNGMLMFNVPHYKSEYLMPFVDWTKALRPSEADTMDLSKCNEFNVWVHAAHNWGKKGQPTGNELYGEFYEQLVNMYKVARLNDQKAIVVTKFGTYAFAGKSKNIAPGAFDRALKTAHAKHGDGIEVHVVDSTPECTPDKTMAYLEEAYDAVKTDDEKIVIATAAKNFAGKHRVAPQYPPKLAAAVAALDAPSAGGIVGVAPGAVPQATVELSNPWETPFNEAYHWCKDHGGSATAYLYTGQNAINFLYGTDNGADRQQSWFEDHVTKPGGIKSGYKPSAKAFFVQIGNDSNVTINRDKLIQYKGYADALLNECRRNNIPIDLNWENAIRAYLS